MESELAIGAIQLLNGCDHDDDDDDGDDDGDDDDDDDGGGGGSGGVLSGTRAKLGKNTSSWLEESSGLCSASTAHICNLLPPQQIFAHLQFLVSYNKYRRRLVSADFSNS